MASWSRSRWLFSTPRPSFVKKTERVDAGTAKTIPRPRHVVASTRARELEYPEEALEEADAAARWYAERSLTAAAAISDELDAAESAIAQFPEAWPRFDRGTHRYLLRRFPFSVVCRIEPRRVLMVAVAHGCRPPLLEVASVSV
jgi:plasmid stabilization system protein ParE